MNGSRSFSTSSSSSSLVVGFVFVFLFLLEISLFLCLCFCVWLRRKGKKMLENLGMCFKSEFVFFRVFVEDELDFNFVFSFFVLILFSCLISYTCLILCGSTV